MSNALISRLISLISILITYYCCYGDEGYYITADSSVVSNDNINLNYPPVVINTVITSYIYQADTLDDIYVTYIGRFATSGPHLLSSSFQRGNY